MTEYPKPPPYYPPPYLMNEPLRTESGIKFFCVALVLSLIFSIISLMSNFIIENMSRSFSSESMMSLLCISGIASLLMLGLGLAALVFFIIALVYLYQGRNEFGLEHKKNVKKGLVLIFVVIGCVILMDILIIGMFMIAMSSITANPDQSTSFGSSILIIFVIIVVIGIITSVCTHLIYYFFATEVAPDEDKFRLKIACASGIILMIGYVSLVVLLYTVQIPMTYYNTLGYIQSILSIFVLAMIALVYYRTYKAIKDGETQPVFIVD